MINLGDRSLPALTTILLLALLLVSAPGAAQSRLSDPSASPAPTQFAQLIIEQRVIVRIPTVRGEQRSGLMREGESSSGPPPSLKEGKGPKCLRLNRLRGASINPASGVTMLVVPHERFRTHFGRACRPADFYAGFYIEPNKDGTICAGRDRLHTRNGSSCEIVKFSRLTPDDDTDERRDR